MSGTLWISDGGTGTYGTVIQSTQTTANSYARIETYDDEGVTNKTKGEIKDLHPKLVMKALKTAKLKPPELTELQDRLKKLGKMVIAAEEAGQRALHDTLAKEIAGIVKQQEAVSIGHGLRVERKVIEKFVRATRDKVIKFDKLDNFPRTIPKKVREKIQEVKEKEVFDEYHVVYVDYSGEKAPKSTKDKIREKDPILFGTFAIDDTQMYYITDWIDKYCDLTISKLVDSIQEEDPEFELDRVPDPTPEYLAAIVAKVEKDAAELDSTRASNYLAKMLDQEKKNSTGSKASKDRQSRLSRVMTDIRAKFGKKEKKK